MRAAARASDAYEPLLERLTLRATHVAGHRIARAAQHISRASLPTPTRYLEIGAFEGQSVAFTHALLDGEVKITVIDPFPEEAGHDLFAAFTSNLETLGIKEDVRVLRGRSIDHLPTLIDNGELFDLIYIDGSHATLDVLLDAVLCWPLLTRGGMMIFDDYWFRDTPKNRPKLAVDAFVGAVSHEIEVLDVAGQVFLRRR